MGLGWVFISGWLIDVGFWFGLCGDWWLGVCVGWCCLTWFVRFNTDVGFLLWVLVCY